jgi:transposase-like protein
VQRDRLSEHLVAGTTAPAAAELVGVHRNTAASRYTRLRRLIAVEMEKALPAAAAVKAPSAASRRRVRIRFRFTP